jgi:hypothetical protein
VVYILHQSDYIYWVGFANKSNGLLVAGGGGAGCRTGEVGTSDVSEKRSTSALEVGGDGGGADVALVEAAGCANGSSNSAVAVVAVPVVVVTEAEVEKGSKEE